MDHSAINCAQFVSEHAIKANGRLGVHLHPFANSAVDGSGWVAPLLSRINPEQNASPKVHPITGHEGPDGVKKYTSTLPSTSAPDEGGWSTPHPDRFIPGEDPLPIVQEAG